jgi:hypothetical protein
LLGVGLAALAGGVAGAFLLDHHGGGSKQTPAPVAGAIHLRGVTAYDPQGSPPGQEHNDQAKNATDGNPSTFWPTEHYNGARLNKSGVGVVLDAGRSVRPKTITVTTDTPGFTAQIQAGDSEGGPFRSISRLQQVGKTTTFHLLGGGRYFVVWITALGGYNSVHVNEVRAG